MTDSGPPEEAPDSSDPVDRAGTRPGIRTFTIEGRAAPGLFVGGWIAFLMGAGALIVALLAGGDQLGTLILVTVAFALMSIGFILGAGSQAIERRVRSFAYAGPSPFLVFAAFVASSQFLFLVIGRPANALGLDPASPAATLLGVSVQTIAFVGLVRLLVVSPGALHWADMGLARRTSRALAADIGWGAVSAVLAVAGSLLIGLILLRFLPAPDAPLSTPTGGLDLVIDLLAVAIVAPLGEEVFFRGFATVAWFRTMPVGRAVVRAAIFFAVIHTIGVGGQTFGDGLGRAVVAFSVRLPIAFGLEAIFVQRRSLPASIAMHATYNAISVLIAFVTVGA